MIIFVECEQHICSYAKIVFEVGGRKRRRVVAVQPGHEIVMTDALLVGRGLLASCCMDGQVGRGVFEASIIQSKSK